MQFAIRVLEAYYALKVSIYCRNINLLLTAFLTIIHCAGTSGKRLMMMKSG